MVHLAKEVDFEKSKCELGIGLTNSFVHSLHWSKLQTQTGQSLLLFCLKTLFQGGVPFRGGANCTAVYFPQLQPASDFTVSFPASVLKVVCFLFFLLLFLLSILYGTSAQRCLARTGFIFNNIPYGTIFHFHLQGRGWSPSSSIPRPPTMAHACTCDHMVSPFPTFPPPKSSLSVQIFATTYGCSA